VHLPEYWVTLLNYIGLYAIVAIGLVLLTGIGGMTSFGQAAFVGVGAYTTAFLTTQYGVSPWLALIVGVVLTALIALILGAGDHAAFRALPAARHDCLGAGAVLPVRQSRHPRQIRRHQRHSGAQRVRYQPRVRTAYLLPDLAGGARRADLRSEPA
jgi:hypothetical protein